METIKEILIRRDSMTESEADSLIEDAKEALNQHILKFEFYKAENICQFYFGLEPDYIFELL